ncbi:hypothetical protein HA466_0211880 [Hirschfeldia incana]|nr:hypothetical protein HA466_0211880 [Hirschfeldia incana]KAJ0241827.1 hypothetical protein HA466_0211880 [Hirschfeldia incana]
MWPVASVCNLVKVWSSHGSDAHITPSIFLIRKKQNEALLRFLVVATRSSLWRQSPTTSYFCRQFASSFACHSLFFVIFSVRLQMLSCVASCSLFFLDLGM